MKNIEFGETIQYQNLFEKHKILEKNQFEIEQ